MNWAAISFDWNQVRAFLATVEEGSLSAAARALRLTQPTLGRQVSALEDSLGVVLFERIGRSLVLTPSGLDLLDHVRDMGEAANRISLAASGRSQVIEGVVRITASDAMSAYFLPSVLLQLRKVAPGIVIEVVASNAIRDLRRREADIAIRHVRPDQPDLIARLVAETTGHLYAAPSYLGRVGRPVDMADMARLDFIGFEEGDDLLNGLNAMGLNLTRRNFPIVADNGVVAWEMTKQGLGVGVMTREIAELTPEVEVVLPDIAPIPVPVWLTTHRELHSSRRIRLVYDLLAQALG
ncbi:MAG: LysR family transcriptional regulator [Rhodobacteraceae bacterium]|nr:MAG: LysR family transcriptional regulator [Paracoccaceae bacterium]